MNTRKHISILKVFPTLLGLTSISVLASLPVLASQSSPNTANNSELLLAQDSPEEVSSPAIEADSDASSNAEPTTTTPAASDLKPTDSAETKETPEGSAEQPAEAPAASDLKPGESAEVPDNAAEEGAEAPAASDSPTTTPPVASPEGDATQPAPPIGETPAPPTEEAAPGATPTETEQPSTSSPPGATPDSGAQTTVSDAELKQFATSIPQLSTIEKSTKGEITQIISESGLSQDKFSALVSGKQSGTPPAEATAEEKQSFEQAITKIQAIEQKGQAEQEKIIRAQGMEPQRFVQILAAVRQDPNLMTKVKQILQTK